MKTAFVTAPPDEFVCLDILLRRRHSCRAFLPQPVPREVIQQVLVATQRTASWCNAQPWQVHILSGDALERLRCDMLDRAKSNAPSAPEVDWPREWRGAYQARRRSCGWDLYRAVGVEKGDREGSARQAIENFRMFGAPHLAIVSSDEALGPHGVMDCGAWVSNFMLAACAAGMSTIAQAALASWPDVLRKHIDLSTERRIVCGVSFGFCDTKHPANGFRTTRAALDEVITWLD